MVIRGRFCAADLVCCRFEGATTSVLSLVSFFASFFAGTFRIFLPFAEAPAAAAVKGRGTGTSGNRRRTHEVVEKGAWNENSRAKKWKPPRAPPATGGDVHPRLVRLACG